jgi:hypothetical protein
MRCFIDTASAAGYRHLMTKGISFAGMYYAPLN